MTVWVMLMLLFSDGDVTPHAVQYADKAQCDEKLIDVMRDMPAGYQVYGACIPFTIDGQGT